MGRLALRGIEDLGHDPLDLVLTEFPDQPFLLGNGLQRVDRVDQLHFSRPHGRHARHAALAESNEMIIFAKKLSVRLLQDISFRCEFLLASDAHNATQGLTGGASCAT